MELGRISEAAESRNTEPTTGTIRADGAITITDGPDLPPPAKTLLEEIRSARPGARKIGVGMVCTAPLSDGLWLFRHFATLPEGKGIAAILAELEAEAQAGRPTPPGSADLVAAAHRAGRMRRRYRLGWLATEIADLLSAPMVAIIRVREGKPGKIWMNAGATTARRDELKQLLRQALAEPDGAEFRRIRATDTAPEALDAALIAQAFETGWLSLGLPPEKRDGHAVLVASPEAPEWLREIPALADLLRRPARTGRGPSSRALRRVAALAVCLAIGVWLSLPAPMSLSSQGRAVPAETRVIALPFASFVDTVHISPGDVLASGDTVAQLTEPDLQAQLSEQEVTLALEDINAAAALDEGNYADFQLAENRAEIARLRMAQLTERLDMLSVRAPVAGTVVEALAAGDRGQFLPAGTEIARLQPAQAYDILVDLAPGDTPLVEPGQTARVRFRGISDGLFEAEVVGRPQQVQDPETGLITTSQRLRVTDGPQDRLLVGLTGIARIELEEAPRIFGWLRPAISHTRYLAWRYFGIQN